MLFTALFILCLLYSTISKPQGPEINDQFEVTDTTYSQTDDNNTTEPETTTVVSKFKPQETKITAIEPQDGITFRIYNFITEPIIKILNAPKVTSVIRNIGTCVVNGAMEIISHYLPAPFIPIIASAAGLVIPFEPIVMLKQKMPVTSYRRAFKTAMNSFLNTFDKYKVDDEYDPYMTRRFNRRFMNDDKERGNDLQ